MTKKEAANKASIIAKEINVTRAAERRAKALEKVDKEEFIDFYKSHNQTDTMQHFNLARWELMYIIKYYEIKKTRQDVGLLLLGKSKKPDVNKRRATIINNYGSWEAYRTQLTNRVKQTKLNRYGDEKYNNPDKAKQTLIAHYGSIEEANKAKIHSMQNTLESRYGDLETAYKKMHTKTEETIFRRYGVKCSLWADSVEPKVRTTFVEKYGVPYYCMTADCKSKTRNNSKINKEFSKLLDLHNISYNREFSVETRSYDFKINNILVEIDPSITHNSSLSPFGDREGLSPSYHKDKSELAEKHGFRCIHVWDWDDWDKIINLLVNKPRLYARTLTVKNVPINEAKQFVLNNHLQGWCKGNTVLLGLYTIKNELVELMTFGKPRYNAKAQWELLRLCSSNYRIVGGAEKLFKHFIATYEPHSIISYCDRSKFTGDVYGRLGFKQVSKASPSAHWVSLKNGKHITDMLLRQRGFDQLFGKEYGYYGKGTSNEQLMLVHGFVKLYDCGQQSYVYNEE